MAIENQKNGANRCPHCGSTDVGLDTKSGKLKCSFCRSLFEGTLANKENNISVLKGDVVAEGATAIIPGEDIILTLKCPACGAEVVINTEEVTSARCHWCRHTLSVNEKLPNGAVPDLVLPFKLEKNNARGKIEEFVRKRKFFAHPKFKKEFTTENILGAYLPYMVVDANAHATFSGEAEHQTRTYTRRVGNSEQRYYDAEAYKVSRDFDLLVDDLTIEASADKLNQDTLVNTNNVISSVMPFDTENCVAWNPAFLKGYASEKRDTDVSALGEKVDLQIGDVARYQARQTLKHYDRGARWDNENVTVKGRQWKAAYLPVWLYSYMQEKNGKKLLHYVAVNARTGETMGSVPINKTLLTIVSAIIEVFGIILGWTWFKFWIGVDTDEDNPALLGALGLTPGFIYYWLMTKRYRNMDARHKHEAETKSEARNMKETDELIGERKALHNARIEGENDNVVKGVVAQNAKTMVGEKFANYLGIGKMDRTNDEKIAMLTQAADKVNNSPISKIVRIIRIVIIAGAILFILFIILAMTSIPDPMPVDNNTVTPFEHLEGSVYQFAEENDMNFRFGMAGDDILYVKGEYYSLPINGKLIPSDSEAFVAISKDDLLLSDQEELVDDLEAVLREAGLSSDGMSTGGTIKIFSSPKGSYCSIEEDEAVKLVCAQLTDDNIDEFNSSFK